MDSYRDYTTYFWIRRGARRKRVLLYLDQFNKPATPTHIAKSLGIKLNKVSETLSSFRKRHIVELLDNEKFYNRRYLITTDGVEAAKILKKQKY